MILIKSNSTDQLVSRNHRCLVERNGNLVFEFAENLNDMEKVPVLSHNISLLTRSKKNIKAKTYSTTMATITKQEYSGIIFCPTVSTGCFVARRNNKVFITGNSGFPKSMNISLALDKKEGLQGQRGIGGFNVGGIQEQQNRKAKLYIGSTTDGSKQKAYTDLKSDLAKQWKGWGTALKPSYEPIIVARKPFKGSLVDNVIEYGVGGINIDECRVKYEKTTNPATNPLYRQQNADKYKQVQGGELSNGAVSWTSGKNGVNDLGRFPANTILTYDETDFDEVCGGFPNTKSNGGETSMPDFRDAGKKSKEAIGIDKLPFGQVNNVERKESNYLSI